MRLMVHKGSGISVKEPPPSLDEWKERRWFYTYAPTSLTSLTRLARLARLRRSAWHLAYIFGHRPLTMNRTASTWKAQIALLNSEL